MAAKCFQVYTTLQLIVIVVLSFVEVIQAKALWGKPPTLEEKDGQAQFPKLIIISFDGFRWDYLTRTKTPNFDKFIENGVTAKYGLRNAFVTKTFPNHFTLATGLWEESHGIVANDMYDPDLNQTFNSGNISAMEDPAWFSVGAEPIWVTNQLQTLNGRSGVIMWVGGGAPIKWVTPSRYVAYNKNVKNETKVDMLIEWFMDKYPINLGMIYFDQPDGVGHTFGPDSPEVTRMIGGLDDVVGYLLQRLQETGLLDNMNIILTSDHGFTATPAENMIDLDNYINPDSYRFSVGTPIANIWPEEGKEEEIYLNLTAGAKQHGNFSVYKREEVPVHFHYSNNRRIPPIIAVANDTFSFCTGMCNHTENGNHGYDNRLQDMHPFFLAMGPSFKKNVSVDTFDNVDVYPLMCHLLGVSPAPNNGSLFTVSQLLVLEHETEDSRIIIFTFTFTAILIACVGGAFAVRVCKKSSQRKRNKYGDYSSITDSPPTCSAETTADKPDTATDISVLDSKFNDSKVPLLLDQEHDVS